MELVFLAVLLLLMVMALSAGYPVAFALPGSAILSIAIAALCGAVFAGDVDAFFAQGSATQWLSSGVTNFRSLYWDVERDTLIAIPLFVFMGIMLQRSKIAEDLLVAMAQLFGPVPGGLGISVVLVGALLAATTGIVGATVIAMGLISLPAMMRNNYSKSLASGTICASGTLGQIIPPSIVLIILADQLASAADQASSLRKAEYKEATGEFSMPSILDVGSASAGDMFMGALVPGLILVALYVLYILGRALLRPQDAPPVPYEGDYDRQFFQRILLALTPPLILIFVVLGSIIMGVATVNQAGSIGAIGAILMGAYRLAEGKKHAYTPALLALGSIVALVIILSMFEVNVKNIRNSHDALGVALATVAVLVLLFAIGWSTVRTWRINDTLVSVMIETAKTTSMVFIILIGAAMLTSAFRAFGGEELVRHFLTGLPGGFWTQFIVVMAVIFLLGFFLDFIEIAVVVVPIVAPILLADPAANVTAVWLGVMVGMNIQTSFLTPPFGFALFYLRGVAPPEVKTTHIYKGAAVFIGIQLLGLAIAGYWPSLVNYLPARTYLTSETAPPPVNPRLQYCLEEHVFSIYDQQQGGLMDSIAQLRNTPQEFLPESWQKDLNESLDSAGETFANVAAVREAQAELDRWSEDYRPVHRQLRLLRRDLSRLEGRQEELEALRDRLEPGEGEYSKLETRLAENREAQSELESGFPEGWQDLKKGYDERSKTLVKLQRNYRRGVDESWEVIEELRTVIAASDTLTAFEPRFADVAAAIEQEDNKAAMDDIKAIESEVAAIAGASKIRSALSKARRALKGSKPKRERAREQLVKAKELFATELGWRQQAKEGFAAALEQYHLAGKGSIGLRLQARLNSEQAGIIARCQAVHRDVSLNF